MNEKCKIIQGKILNDASEESVSAHLKECGDCANFANFAENIRILMLEKTQSEEIPAKLDAAVKAKAAEYLRGRKGLSFLIFNKNIISIAAVAGFLLISSVIFIQNNISDSMEKNKINAVTPPISEKNIVSEKNLKATENFDLEDELFILSTNLILCKEFLKYYLYLDEEFTEVNPLENTII